MKSRSSIIWVLILLTVECRAQLTVNAGMDTVFCEGSFESAIIGGAPTAKGGVPPYVYSWSTEYVFGSHEYTASDMLEDTTSANPVFKKGWYPDSVVLFLTVMDSINSTAHDSIWVRFPTFIKCAGECREYIGLGDSVEIGHCISGGLLPYRYSWSPGITLSDSMIGSPWAKPSLNTTYELLITDSYRCTTRAICRVFINPMIVQSDKTRDSIICTSPNPANSQVTFKINLDNLSEIKLLIINPNGQIIKEIRVHENEICVDVSNQTPGFYLFQINRRNDIVKTGKFMIN